MSKILFVAGTFNENGGIKSILSEKIYKLLNACCENINYINGGTTEQLQEIKKSISTYNAILWWANSPDTGLEAFKYSLEQRTNTLFSDIYEGKNEKHEFKIYSNSNKYYEGSDINVFVQILINQIEHYKDSPRSRTICVGSEAFYSHDEKDFLTLLNKYSSRYPIKGAGYKFNSNLCFYAKNNNRLQLIKVSDFKPIKPGTMYFEQLLLVRLCYVLPMIKYVIYSDDYIKGAPYIKIEKDKGFNIDDIIKTILNSDNAFFVFNIKKYGSVVMSDKSFNMESIQYI